MNLKKMLLVAASVVTLSGNALATFCVPVCVPNPCNYGPKPVVSDCGGGRDDDKKPKCRKCRKWHKHRDDDCDGRGGVKIVIIIIKVIFGCRV